MATRFIILLDKLKSGTLSGSEKKEIRDMLQSGLYQKELEEAIDRDWHIGDRDLSDPESLELIYQQILVNREQPKAKVIRMNRRWWAVAAVLIILSASLFWFIRDRGGNSMKTPVAAISRDAKPAYEGAVLTLADGSDILLDSAGDNLIARQGNVTIKQQEGRVNYQGEQGDISMMNTLTTAKGQQSPVLLLADGTKVWLNAASSITFPVSFSGSARSVSITGEAYFEVAYNPEKPFIVTSEGQDVRVLGTRFNIRAYSDESDTRTTLSRGSVEVIEKREKNVLKLSPGQQASLSNENNKLAFVQDADVETALAWRNGYFAFQHAGLPEVMREFSRWYNVDVVYTGAIPKREFDGKIQRNLMLSQVMKMLDLQQVNYKIENQKIIIMP